MEIERSIDVAAGPAAAFALATDLARSPEWVSSIEGFERDLETILLVALE